jgi:hypothetical protein
MTILPKPFSLAAFCIVRLHAAVLLAVEDKPGEEMTPDEIESRQREAEETNDRWDGDKPSWDRIDP